MKNQIVLKNCVTALDRAESASIIGGGDFTNYARCVSATMTSGGAALRTLALGITIFGMARLLGAARGCSNL